MAIRESKSWLAQSIVSCGESAVVSALNVNGVCLIFARQINGVRCAVCAKQHQKARPAAAGSRLRWHGPTGNGICLKRQDVDCLSGSVRPGVFMRSARQRALWATGPNNNHGRAQPSHAKESESSWWHWLMSVSYIDGHFTMKSNNLLCGRKRNPRSIVSVVMAVKNNNVLILSSSCPEWNVQLWWSGMVRHGMKWQLGNDRRRPCKEERAGVAALIYHNAMMSINEEIAAQINNVDVSNKLSFGARAAISTGIINQCVISPSINLYTCINGVPDGDNVCMWRGREWAGAAHHWALAIYKARVVA